MRIVRGMTPNWFAVGMGTGIVGLDAFLLPHGGKWLHLAGTSIWFLNMAIVLVLSGLMIARFVVDGQGVRDIFHHPNQSLFFGAIPMALTTVVNGFFDIGGGLFGHASYEVGAVLWIINTAIALASVITIPYLMFVAHDHHLSRMTAAWLMPIVPAEVVAASGTLLLAHVANPAMRGELIIGVLVLWALSVPLAFLLLGVLFLRLAVHNVPPKEMAISTWISLGTIGTGIMGLMGLALNVGSTLPAAASGLVGAASLIAVVLWGFGAWWLVQSALITIHYMRLGSLPFNLGWWGLTFPIGVFEGGTVLLGHFFGSPIFTWSSYVLFSLLGAFWIMVAASTVLHANVLRRVEKPVMVDEEAKVV